MLPHPHFEMRHHNGLTSHAEREVITPLAPVDRVRDHWQHHGDAG